MSTQEIIELMVQVIVSRFHPLRIILFGSQARGEATRDSDIDLLVVMPGEVNRRRITVDILHALHNMPAPKDIIVTTEQEIATPRTTLLHHIAYGASGRESGLCRVRQLSRKLTAGDASLMMIWRPLNYCSPVTLFRHVKLAFTLNSPWKKHLNV